MEEEKLNKIFDKREQRLAGQTQSTFLAGFVCGAIFAYSGTAGFVAGLGAGCVFKFANWNWAQGLVSEVLCNGQTMINKLKTSSAPPS